MQEIDRESTFGRLYRRFYEGICGRHPAVRPWHFQWLDTFYLMRTLERLLPEMEGEVLDVGCGSKPYRSMFRKASGYTGIDIAGEEADAIVGPHDSWPYEDESFDVVFSTQVVEHVEDLTHTLSEIDRVLRPGGSVSLSFPFLFNEHGAPWDYRRLTTHGAARLLPYEVVHLERQGGVGSTVVILVLNWIDASMNLNRPLRMLKGLMTPLWIPFCFVANLFGACWDRIDMTATSYNNVFVIFRKPTRNGN